MGATLHRSSHGRPGCRCVSRSVPRVYVSVSRLRVDPGRAAELVAAFRSRAGLVDNHDGFVDLQVWRSDRDLGEILMVSRWRDREAFTTYMRSQDHHTSHARIPPDLKAAIRLERLEQLHTYEVVAE
jgi:heme-degrading monooxygenase HmoA